MCCFSFLFQNFLSFSGIFYGSSPLWESAIKVCDVTELLEVSVPQAHVPCSSPSVVTSQLHCAAFTWDLTLQQRGNHSLASSACLSVPCASGSFLKVPYWGSREKAHWWGLCMLALPSMLRHQEEVWFQPSLTTVPFKQWGKDKTAVRGSWAPQVLRRTVACNVALGGEPLKGLWVSSWGGSSLTGRRDRDRNLTFVWETVRVSVLLWCLSKVSCELRN